MYHWNEMYWETYLSDITNTETVISFKNLGLRWDFRQTWIDITWNNDQNVKLVKQLMTGFKSFLRRGHNTVIPLTAYCGLPYFANKIYGSNHHATMKECYI